MLTYGSSLRPQDTVEMLVTVSHAKGEVLPTNDIVVMVLCSECSCH